MSWDDAYYVSGFPLNVRSHIHTPATSVPPTMSL